jgi:hypothetical protein
MSDLSDEQQEYLQGLKDKGIAFKGMVHDDGWKHIKYYYEEKIKIFATRMLTGDQSIEEFERERWELQGIRKLFAFVDSCISELENGSKATGTTEE